MKIKYEINKLYRKNAIISTCCVGYQKYMNNESKYLPIKYNNEWYLEHIPPVKNYKNYSHGYQPVEFEKLMQQFKK